MIDPELLLILCALFMGAFCGYTVGVFRYKFACGNSIHEHWRTERDDLLKEKARLIVMIAGMADADPSKRIEARKKFYEGAYSAMLTKRAGEK